MDLETRIGAVWFNRIGIVALLVAFALFARVVHQRLLPWHKVTASYAAAIALFFFGKLFERKLQQFARPVMAGGLALAFFTSFAAHFLPAMSCLGLPASLALMSVSIAALFVCAERWKSEPTALFAVFLGHTASYVASGDADAFSLVAIVFLSASAIILFVRHDWAPLGLFAVVAAYASHFLWAVQEHPASTPEHRFWANFAFFTAYHVVFLAADIVFVERCFRQPDRYTRAQRLAGRCVGPVSVVLYAAFCGGIFEVTQVYWSSVHLWLFPLAALETALAAFHRRRASPEVPFHALAAVAFATLGLFSWLGGLTLNLALAVESLLLLALAHRLQLGYVHLISQATLGVSFVHYWLSNARDLDNWPSFAGSTATALVYFVHARGEEAGHAAGAHPAFLSGSEGAKSLAGTAARIWALLAMPRAIVHSVLGASLIAYSCSAFFDVPHDALAIAAFAAAIGAAGWLLRSRAAAFAIATLEATGAVLCIGHRTAEQIARRLAVEAAASPAFVWCADHVLVAVGAAAAVSAAMLAGRRRGWAATSGAVLALLLLAPLAAAAARVGEPRPWIFPLWLLAPAALALPAFRRDFGVRWPFPLLAAAVLVFIARPTLPSDPAALWFLVGAGLAAVGLATAADAPALLPGIVGLIAGSNPILWRALGRPAALEDPRSMALWAYVAGALAASALTSAAGLVRRRCSMILAGLASLAIASWTISTFALENLVSFTPIAAWLGMAPLFWLAGEPLRSAFEGSRSDPQVWRDRLGFHPLRDSAQGLAFVISLAGAAFLAALTLRYFGSGRAVEVIGSETAYAVLLLAAALALRSPSLGAAYAASLTVAYAAYVHLVALPLLHAAPIAERWLTLTLAGAGLVCGAAIEKLHRLRKPPLPIGAEEWSAAGVLHAALPALLLGCWAALEHAHRASELGRTLSMPAAGAVAFAALAGATALGLRWLACLAQAVLLAAAGLLATRWGLGLPSLAIAASAAALEMVAGERLVRLGNGGTSTADQLVPALRRASVIGAAAILLYAAYVSRELTGLWTTVCWSGVALVFATLGFAWRESMYRRVGLIVFAASILRIAIVDIRDLEIAYRMLAFFGLGASLLAVSFLYTKYRDEIRKWI